MTGALILDKPEGISSHEAVARARRLLSEPRIGHLGTLDPFATGVLVLLIGEATRLARFYLDREKTYEGTIRFGYSTDSYDRTGNPTSAEQSPVMDAGEMGSLLRDLAGTRLQQPPPISAKKVGGARAYQLTRKGRPPVLAAVPVTIHAAEMLWTKGPLVGFRIRVSSGTYIRSIAHDLGARVGCGAHLAQLRRTAVGEFQESAAVDLEMLENQIRSGTAPLLAAEDLLPEFPALALAAEQIRAASHGNSVVLACSAEWVKLLDDAGHLLAIAARETENLYHPVVVLKATCPELH